MDESRLEQIHGRMASLLAAEEIILDGIYFCARTCRRSTVIAASREQLWPVAQRELGFAAQEGFVIGDRPCDVTLGQRLGATTLLVLTGYGSRNELDKATQPDFVVANLKEAATAIERFLQKEA